MKKEIIVTEQELFNCAKEILKLAGETKLFVFYGNLGTGKTTLIKTLCNCLGVSNNLSSPSFSIVNEYEFTAGKKITHMDLYRIKHKNELFDLGIEDYFKSSEYCFVEWPQVAENILPEKYIEIRIDFIDVLTRKITFEEIKK